MWPVSLLGGISKQKIRIPNLSPFEIFAKKGLIQKATEKKAQQNEGIMSTRIERDRGRFKKIVRGTIKTNIKRYISKGELIGRKGKDLISILKNDGIPVFTLTESMWLLL